MRAIAQGMRAAALVAAGLSGSGCDVPGGDVSGTTEPAVEVTGAQWSVLEAASPLEQEGYAGELAPSDPTVRVLTDDGQPAVGVRVRFSVFVGGGSVSAARVDTDAQGYASVQWRLGAEPGRNRVRATLPSREIVRFTAQASARAAVADVEVVPGTVTLNAIDATSQLVAYALDASGATLPEVLTWHSANPSVATVDSAGTVRALANGSAAVVAAAANGVADTALVTVAQQVASVRVSPSADTLSVGASAQFAAAARDVHGHLIANAPVQWASRQPSVASVDATGRVSGVTPGTADVTATADGVVGETRIVVTGGAQALFRSDWTTALGSSTSALLDANQPHPWSSLLNNGNALRVIGGAAVGMPGNALEVRAIARSDGAGAYAANIRASNLAVPAVGESRYYRWYMNVTVPDAYTADPLTHPIQDGPQGSRTNWMFEVMPAANGTWQVALNVNGGGVNAWPNNRWRLATPLQKNRTYRFEIALHRIGTSTFRMQARVYDAAGTLLHDDADFANVDGSRSLADGTALAFNDVAQMANFQCGLNGLAAGSASEFPFVVFYQAAFEMRADRWPGAY